MGNRFIPFKTKKYLAIAREPIYVGTGGYRIGRVDNTIVRDPATNLPKIPGTTISGNARYYSWLKYKSEGMDVSLGCAKGKKTEGEDACGICPICLTYGFVNDEKAHSGLAYFSDARILFFPVSTMIGTVWIISDEIMKDFINVDIKTLGNGEFLASDSLSTSLPQDKEGQKLLNFGWIMLRHSEDINLNNWSIKGEPGEEEICDLGRVLGDIGNKVCVVSSEVFSYIVNSNLETRTSVSINPVTGAAESGALFTFEALPRGTIFILDVAYENPINYNKAENIGMIISTVEDGFKLFSSLGIGGMGTRGFGKIEIEGNMLGEKEYWEEVEIFLEKIQKEVEELQKELEKLNNKNEEKNKICKKLDKKNKILSIWKEYIEKEKNKLNEEIENFQDIIELFSKININKIHDFCNE